MITISLTKDIWWVLVTNLSLLGHFVASMVLYLLLYGFAPPVTRTRDLLVLNTQVVLPYPRGFSEL